MQIHRINIRRANGRTKQNSYIIGEPTVETIIGKHAYASNQQLVKVRIADGVTEIGDFAFEYCMNLASVVIPDSMTEIGSEAFDGCVQP